MSHKSFTLIIDKNQHQIMGRLRRIAKTKEVEVKVTELIIKGIVEEEIFNQSHHDKNKLEQKTHLNITEE